MLQVFPITLDLLPDLDEGVCVDEGLLPCVPSSKLGLSAIVDLVALASEDASLARLGCVNQLHFGAAWQNCHKAEQGRARKDRRLHQIGFVLLPPMPENRAIPSFGKRDLLVARLHLDTCCPVLILPGAGISEIAASGLLTAICASPGAASREWGSLPQAFTRPWLGVLIIFMLTRRARVHACRPVLVLLVTRLPWIVAAERSRAIFFHV
mmetsp:Transcript_128933/g.321610  ORF Transcript_128933/g.321610 Transcript_128933/m.321610 type:complete len:210 (-) Transcript_128933:110-739(-)